jgi:hypothetical protein
MNGGASSQSGQWNEREHKQHQSRGTQLSGTLPSSEKQQAQRRSKEAADRDAAGCAVLRHRFAFVIVYQAGVDEKRDGRCSIVDAQNLIQAWDLQEESTGILVQARTTEPEKPRLPGVTVTVTGAYSLLGIFKGPLLLNV